MSRNPYLTNGEPAFPEGVKKTETKRHSRPPNYQFVRTGLGLVYVAMIGLFLGLLSYLIYLFSFASISNLRQASLDAAFYFQIYSWILTILTMVGYCFCCGAPKKDEREKIHLVVALQVLCFLVGILTVPVVTYMLRINSEVEIAGVTLIAVLLAQLIGSISMFCFISFCKQLGIGSHQVTDATTSAKLWLLVCMTSMVLVLLTFFVLLFLPEARESLLANLFLSLLAIVLVGSALTFSIKKISMVRHALEYLKEKTIQSQFKKLPRHHRKKIQESGKSEA